MKIEISVGDYINGFEIVAIKKDPFIKGQVNLWTNQWRVDQFGDRELVVFRVASCVKKIPPCIKRGEVI